MTFRTPMLRRLAVLCVLAAMLVAATGCTALKNGDDKPDAGATGDLGADLGIVWTDLGIAEWDLGQPIADQGVPPVDLGFYDDAGAADLGSADLGSADLGPSDLGPSDMGPPDLGPPDLGPPDMGPRCAPRPSGDTRWPQYALPGTSGHPRSYQVLGTAPNETVIDCVTGLEWQRAVDAGSYTQAEAIAYCDGLTLAGYTDWRLPSTIELLTLVDYSVASPGPTIDADKFPSTPATYFWSASSVAGSPTYGWNVRFSHGIAHNLVATDPYRARCVRGNDTVGTAMGAPPGHFTVGTDATAGTVRDNLTGLVWQQGFSPEPQTQAASITYCATLGLAGSAPWRLPTVLELRSIVDETVSSPSTDPAYVPSTPAEAFWSSSSFAGSLSFGWYVDFYYGVANFDDAAILSRARCVR